MTTTANPGPNSYALAYDVLRKLGPNRETTTRLLGLLDDAGVEAVARLPRITAAEAVLDWLPKLPAVDFARLFGLTGQERFVEALQAELADTITTARPTSAVIAEVEAYLIARRTTAEETR